MKRHPLSRSRRTSRGIALIEALVGILIFALGALGLVGLQASMTRAQSTAKFRSDASQLAGEILAVMTTDPSNVGKYVGCGSSSVPACQDWQAKLASALPSGTGDVTADASGSVTVLTVSVKWVQPNEGEHQYTTTTSVVN